MVQRGWGTVPTGRGLYRDAVLRLDGPARAVTLEGLWDLNVSSDGRARVTLDGTVLEGRLRSDSRRICTQRSIDFQVGDLEIHVPAGGEVRLLGVEPPWARVAPPVGELAGGDLAVPLAELSLDSCAPMSPAAEAAIEVPARYTTSACLFSDPSDHPSGQAVPLPTGAPLEILEHRGAWTRVRTAFGGALFAGWVPDGALRSEEPPERGYSMQLAADTAVASFRIQSGAPVLVQEICFDSDCHQRKRASLRVEGPEGVIRLSTEASSLQLDPDPDGRAARWLTPDRCWTTDEPATPPVLVTRGSVSREEIRRTIRSRIDEVRGCYEARLAVRPALEGRLMTSFVIGPTGRVQSVTTSGLDDPFVRYCVSGVLRSLRFASPEGGGVVGINYPFTFHTEE